LRYRLGGQVSFSRFDVKLEQHITQSDAAQPLTVGNSALRLVAYIVRQVNVKQQHQRRLGIRVPIVFRVVVPARTHVPVWPLLCLNVHVRRVRIIYGERV